MVEGVENIVFLQVAKVERRFSIFRIFYSAGLFVLYNLLRNPLVSIKIDHLLALLSFMLLLVYSIIVIVLSRRSSLHERMGHLSNAVDAVARTLESPSNRRTSNP